MGYPKGIELYIGLAPVAIDCLHLPLCVHLAEIVYKNKVIRVAYRYALSSAEKLKNRFYSQAPRAHPLLL